MSYIGHTLLGDDLYANETEKSIITSYISRQALHCNKVTFVHPVTNENISIESNLPKDMLDILN